MNKAFTKEDDENDDSELPETMVGPEKNYMTPEGFITLQTELLDLVSNERPKIVETVRWAAGNGDRSENGDYIYGKRRLREIDRRVRYLTKRIKNASIVDPLQQKNLTKVFFGATVTYAHEDGTEKTIKIVGIDEADLQQGKISWLSPLAKALLKTEIDDNVELRTPEGNKILTVLAISYDN